MKHAELLSIALLTLNTACAQRNDVLSADDVNELPSKAADARIAYGTGPEQFGELRLPKGKGPFPVAILIHGGCWVHAYATLRNTAALADALRDEGIASWNIEYRRADDPGGGWTGTFDDVAGADDHVRELARTYPLDTSRVIAIGHSAGGHLAFWLAARHRLPSSSALFRPRPLALIGTLSLAGPPDLEAFVGQDREACGRPVVARLLGADGTIDPERMKEASPVAWLPFGIRHRLIVGGSDFVMTEALSRSYEQQAKASGDDARYIALPGIGHFELIAPGSPAWPTVRSTVKELLR